LVKIRKVNQLNSSKESGESQPYQQNRIYDLFGISPALCANKSDLIINTPKIRRLTPTECERLQTVKDGYTNYVSDTQRYKMLGNGWTVDVISHIFSYIK
jgi:site-specific DNA-cytosine methylase